MTPARLTADFYVGSRPGFDAWERFPETNSVFVSTVHAVGVWEGVPEHTVIVRLVLPNVQAILDYAQHLATVSDNDCVLAVFDTSGKGRSYPVPMRAMAWSVERVDLNADSTDAWGDVPIGYTVAPSEAGITRYLYVPRYGAALMAVLVASDGSVTHL